MPAITCFYCSRPADLRTAACVELASGRRIHWTCCTALGEELAVLRPRPSTPAQINSVRTLAAALAHYRQPLTWPTKSSRPACGTA